MRPTAHNVPTMFDRLKERLSLAGKPASTGPSLAQRLPDYPPYQAPHVGWGKGISVAAAHENLAYFRAVLPQRLAHVGALVMTDAGIDIAPALAAPRELGPDLATQLNAWAGRRWPALHEARLGNTGAWLDSPRQGPDIVWSMVMDVAIVLGELICRANTDWRWDLDLSAENLKDKMASARRVVLLADAVGTMPWPFVDDVEGAVARRLIQIDRANDRVTHMDPWRRLVDEGQRGVAMEAWRS